jgi:ABC-2 type transport system permease protein
MRGVVFFETFRRGLRPALIWAVMIGLLGILVIFMVQDSEALAEYARVFESMPAFVVNMVGGAEAKFMATPEGFLAVGYFGRVILFMAAFGVVAGMNITANEEDSGILDTLLSVPIPRWRVVVEKALAYSALTALVLLSNHLILWVATLISPVFETTFGALLAANLSMFPIVVAIMAMTALLGVVLRRRGAALGVASGVVVLTYFVDVIGQSTQNGEALRAFSFFRYVNTGEALRDGLALGNVVGLLAVAVILTAGAVALFQRRDVGL